jgi:hypothetical protein
MSGFGPAGCPDIAFRATSPPCLLIADSAQQCRAIRNNYEIGSASGRIYSRRIISITVANVKDIFTNRGEVFHDLWHRVAICPLKSKQAVSSTLTTYIVCLLFVGFQNYY